MSTRGASVPLEGPPRSPARHASPRRGTQTVEEKLAAIMAVSHAVSEGQALGETLETIAETAASLADAAAAAIILRRHESATGLAVAGSFGLSEEYARELNRMRPLDMGGSGPCGRAARTQQPVTVHDVHTDPIYEPWRGLAVREGFQSMAAVPLELGGGRRVIGTLNTYRKVSGEWSAESIDLLTTLADHAAIAIHTAQLLDESRRQVRGLSLVVRSLRTQSHEHSNLVHAVYGLLAIGEVEEARELIASADTRYRDAYAAVLEGIDNAVVSGFLMAETVTAGNGGIELRLVPGSRLSALPPMISELDAITILGNLVHNAVEAVSEAPDARRRVEVRLSDADRTLTIAARDWGPGIPPEEVPRIFEAGHSTKSAHSGIGLALVRGIVARAGGTIEVDHPDSGGLEVSVSIPF